MDSRFCPLPESTLSELGSLTESVGFELLGADLGKDVESAIQVALSGGAVFPEGDKPLSIFRRTLAGSIRDIQSHPRGRLFQEFLHKGPYEGGGEIPKKLTRSPTLSPAFQGGYEMRGSGLTPSTPRHSCRGVEGFIGKRISDADAVVAITFIYSFMINSFKGAVTELLAAKACSRLMMNLKQDGCLPRNARLYVGDSVMGPRKSGKGALKGADLHVLAINGRRDAGSNIKLAGVVEVKSGRKSYDAMSRQLDHHILRARRGLCVCGVFYPTDKVRIGQKSDASLLRITVQPSDWKLPRRFHFEKTERGRIIYMDDTIPPRDDDLITNLGAGRWHISLKWSKEAIAQAAYEMTFWYMEKVGERIYADRKKMPKSWKKMTPAQAGRNAVKLVLYYAILRCHGRVEQRAIALYNSYGYGYTLGMNFKNLEEKREMLWPQDLDEILSVGKTKNGCTIR